MFYIKKLDIFSYINITICFVLACLGQLCIPKCPRGYQRQQCNETCTCDPNICDDVFGCITTGKICMQYVRSLHLFCEEKISYNLVKVQ